jgi:hypothetical protein
MKREASINGGTTGMDKILERVIMPFVSIVT